MVYLTILASQVWLSSIMVIIVAVSTILQFISVKKSLNNFKREEMSKKADTTYVDKEIKNLSEVTDLKIGRVEQAQEETRTLLEDIQEKVTFVYKKHWED